MRYAMTMLVAAMVLASCAAGTKSYRCPDGTYVVNPTSAPPDCPTGVFNPRSGDALGDTSTNSLSNLTQTGGTAYSCVYLATATEPTCAQIIAGTDGDSAACVDTSSKSAASTSLEFNSTDNHTGMTGSTNYKVSHCVLRNGKKSRAQASASFSTLAGAAPGGGDLTNSGHFVGCGPGASDSNNGLSHATRWASASKVNSSISATGANVYFQTDCVFEDQQLLLDWSGTASDMVEIDTYCIDTSDSNKPKGWTSGGTGCGEKAEINGTFDSCADTNPITCDVGTYNGAQAGSSPIPSSVYSGVLHLSTGIQYAHIKNIKVHDSAGRGVSAKSVNYVVFEGLDIDRSAFNSIVVDTNVTNVVAINNKSNRGADCEAAEDSGRLPGNFVPQTNCGGSAQPACFAVGVTSSNSYSLIAGNQVTNCGGEAFNPSRGSHIWFEQNIAYDSGVSFYGNHNSYVVYLRNLAAGDGNAGFVNQSGMALAMEGNGGDSGNNFMAFNLAVGTNTGFGLRNMHPNSLAAGYTQWGLFYHNTALYPISNALHVMGSGAAATGTENDIKNNIAVVDHASICRAQTTNGSWDYQSWSTALSGTEQTRCSGSNDVVGALTWPHSANDYKNITQDQALSTWGLADYKATGGSENVGAVLSVPSWLSSYADHANWAFAREYDGAGYFMWGAAGCVVNISSAALMTGADCQGLDGTPDIGAVQ